MIHIAIYIQAEISSHTLQSVPHHKPLVNQPLLILYHYECKTLTI
jgi:hypothetical protein